MKTTTKLYAATGAAFLMIAAPAVAQDNIAERAEQITAEAQDVQQQADAIANQQSGDAQYVARDRDDDDGFDWGLLGLLGLAGLLGLRKNEEHHRDIHVDARDGTRDTRTDTRT